MHDIKPANAVNCERLDQLFRLMIEEWAVAFLDTQRPYTVRKSPLGRTKQIDAGQCVNAIYQRVIRRGWKTRQGGSRLP